MKKLIVVCKENLSLLLRPTLSGPTHTEIRPFGLLEKISVDPLPHNYPMHFRSVSPSEFPIDKASFKLEQSEQLGTKLAKACSTPLLCSFPFPTGQEYFWSTKVLLSQHQKPKVNPKCGGLIGIFCRSVDELLQPLK